MKYEVTCNNCGQRYRIEASGGRTVRSVCPNCGHKMLVNLPHVDSDYEVIGSPVDGGNGGNNRKGKGGNNVVVVLLALILGLLAGGIAWLVYQQHKANAEQEFIEKKEARKAHMDSLMQLRNQQEAEEREAKEEQSNRRKTISFLHDFYENCFFGYADPEIYSTSLSEACYNKLSTSADENGEKEIDWSRLGPGFETKEDMKNDREELARNFFIRHESGNWYRIRFSARGMTEYRRIEAFPYHGKIIINDFL